MSQFMGWLASALVKRAISFTLIFMTFALPVLVSAQEMYGPPSPNPEEAARNQLALDEFFANANETINSDRRVTPDVSGHGKVSVYTARGSRDLAWDVGIEFFSDRTCRLYFQYGSMGRQPRNDPGHARIPNINQFEDLGAKCRVLKVETPAGRIGVWALGGITDSDSGKHGIPTYPGYAAPDGKNYKPNWGWSGQHVGMEIDLQLTGTLTAFARGVFYRYHQIDGVKFFGNYFAPSAGFKITL